jgi:hypothetical protein
MRTAKTWAGPFADRFEAGFPVDRNPLRTIGREGEYPVVREDGTAADVTELWDGIEAGGGLVRQREGELTVGLAGAEYSYTIEVGRGTIEVITEPCPDLRSLQLRHEAAMARLLAVARDHGVRVLGYGVQPRTRASRALMTPKQRYQALLDVIGEPWLWFAVTASDQVQVDIARGELIGLTNVGNLLAPVVVALCANSPIQGGFDRGVQSTREARMGEIGAETGRHGMPLGPAVDAKDLVARLGGMPYLLRKEGDRLVADGQRFEDWLESVAVGRAHGGGGAVAGNGGGRHEHRGVARARAGRRRLVGDAPVAPGRGPGRAVGAASDPRPARGRARALRRGAAGARARGRALPRPAAPPRLRAPQPGCQGARRVRRRWLGGADRPRRDPVAPEAGGPVVALARRAACAGLGWREEG